VASASSALGFQMCVVSSTISSFLIVLVLRKRKSAPTAGESSCLRKYRLGQQFPVFRQTFKCPSPGSRRLQDPQETLPDQRPSFVVRNVGQALKGQPAGLGRQHSAIEISQQHFQLPPARFAQGVLQSLQYAIVRYSRAPRQTA